MWIALILVCGFTDPDYVARRTIDGCTHGTKLGTRTRAECEAMLEEVESQGGLYVTDRRCVFLNNVRPRGE